MNKTPDMRHFRGNAARSCFGNVRYDTVLAERDAAGSTTPRAFTYAADPGPLPTLTVPDGWMRRAPGDEHDADIILLTGPRDTDHLRNRLAPVINLYGRPSPWHDNWKCADLATAFIKAEQIAACIRRLPTGLRAGSGTSAELALLARMHVRGGTLEACYAPELSATIVHPEAGVAHDISDLANRLSDAGLLVRKYFDRTQVCSCCGGSRFNVREECARCRSSNISEEMIVHHYRCGHEARESAFRTVSSFQCPKCMFELRHIGLDYDKPGIMLICRTCGAQNDGSVVGFKCLDCGTHADAASVGTRDWYSYALTASGEHYVLDAAAAGIERVPASTDNFRVLLRQMMKEAREFNTTFKVARISFVNDFSAREPVLWGRLMNLAADVVHGAVRPVDAVHQDQHGFLVIFPHAGAHEVATAARAIRAQLLKVLTKDVGAVVTEVPPAEQVLLLNAKD